MAGKKDRALIEAERNCFWERDRARGTDFRAYRAPGIPLPLLFKHLPRGIFIA